MRTRILLTLLLLATLALPALAQRRAVVVHHPRPAGPSRFQLVFEGGAVLPGGDLGDPYIGTEKGMGAETGYELGVRLRYRAGDNLTIGPSFHYGDFGDWEAVAADGTPYNIGTSVYRYGLDLQQFLAGPDAQLRPYVTIGGALIHNRYEDWILGEGSYDTASDNLAATAGVGLAFGPVEISGTWNYNVATLRPLAAPGGDADFDWSYITVRAGLALGH
jgi:opacity protein-like surface antigen